MSLLSPPGAGAIAGLSNGRGWPRWSIVAPRLFPLSRAGLSGCSAMVCVGPPLVLQAGWIELGIGADLIARLGQEAAAGVAAEIVT